MQNLTAPSELLLQGNIAVYDLVTMDTDMDNEEFSNLLGNRKEVQTEKNQRFLIKQLVWL